MSASKTSSIFCVHGSKKEIQTTLGACLGSGPIETSMLGLKSTNTLGGLGGVDWSGSTNTRLDGYDNWNATPGTNRTVMGLFATAFKELGVGHTAGWGSKVGAIGPTKLFRFKTKNEGTYPSQFFKKHKKHIMGKITGLLFATDGQIGATEIDELSKCDTHDVPSIFMIAGAFKDTNTVQQVNVSVIYSLFQKCTNALVVVVYSKNGQSDATTDIVRVVAARGPSFCNYFGPALSENPKTLQDYPQTNYATLRQFKLSITEPVPNGFIQVQTGTLPISRG